MSANAFSHSRSFAAALLLFCAFVLTACELPSRPVSKSAAKMTGDFSSAETLQVLVNLNNGEIQQAELVQQRSNNRSVQQLARAIIEDHTAVNRRIDSLAARGMELEKSPLSRGLKAQAEQIHDNLEELSGSEFDCTYVQKQIEQHELALDTIRSDIRPTTDDAHIQQLLAEVEPALEHHLQRARDIHAQLTGCPAD